MTTRHGNAWVGKVYLMRHRKSGVMVDCAYAEPPTQEEFRDVCNLRGLPYLPEYLMVVELPLVSDTETKVAHLDEWTPPPAPQGVEVKFTPAPQPQGHASWKMKLGGSGVVQNPKPDLSRN